MKKTYSMFFLFLVLSGVLFAQNTDVKKSFLTSGEKEILVNQVIPNMTPANVVSNVKSKGVIKWSQGFEDATFPPAGWSTHNLDGGTQTWVRYASSPIFGTATASVRYESSTLANNDWMVTPSFSVSAGDKLNFYAVGSGSYADSVIVYVSTAGGVPPTGYTRIAGFRPLGAPAQFFNVSLNQFAGQTIYVAFQYKELDMLRLYMDSIYVETPVPNDVGVVSTNANGELLANVPFTPTAIVKNYGTAVNSFNVTMKIGAYTSTKSVTALGIDATSTVTFDSWNPTNGQYPVKVYTQLAGDQNTANDTLSKNITVTTYIYDNGPLVTGPGQGAGGYDISELQNGQLTNYGYGAQSTVGNFICDDFTVPANQSWTIENIVTYSYQTGSTLTSTFNGLKLAIYDANPALGAANLVWGDTTTNRFTSSSFSGIYRILTGSATASDRPIMKVVGAANTTLNAGTYWLVYNFTGSLASGPWAPPISILGTYVTGNAWQKTTGTTWAPAKDSLDATHVFQQGFPFKFTGTVAVTPVELTSFNAAVSNNSVSLNWATSTETNNNGFEIERKSANSSFEKIGFVAGHGTTTTPASYSFVDNLSAAGKYTYRLKQIDFNGKFEYSNEIEVNMNVPQEFSLGQNYPNPFNPSTVIKYALKVDSKVSLKIFNTLGQEVKTLINSDVNAGNHTFELNASDLNSGVYFYRIDASGVDGSKFSSTKKMILVK